MVKNFFTQITLPQDKQPANKFALSALSVGLLVFGEMFFLNILHKLTEKFMCTINYAEIRPVAVNERKVIVSVSFFLKLL